MLGMFFWDTVYIIFASFWQHWLDRYLQMTYCFSVQAYTADLRQIIAAERWGVICRVTLFNVARNSVEVMTVGQADIDLVACSHQAPSSTSTDNENTVCNSVYYRNLSPFHSHKHTSKHSGCVGIPLYLCLVAVEEPQTQHWQRDWTRDQCATVAQLRTFHSLWPAGYLHRIKRRDYATCPHCNGADETAEHLVLQCPAHDQVRRDIWPKGKFNTDPRRLWDFSEQIGVMTKIERNIQHQQKQSY